MNTTKSKKQQIIEEYEKTKVVHPSYGEIAKTVGTYKSYAYKVIQLYLRQNRPTLGQKRGKKRTVGPNTEVMGADFGLMD